MVIMVTWAYSNGWLLIPIAILELILETFRQEKRCLQADWSKTRLSKVVDRWKNHPTPNRIWDEWKNDWNSLSDDFINDVDNELSRAQLRIEQYLKQNKTFQSKKERALKVWQIFEKNPITQKIIEIAQSDQILFELKKLFILALSTGVNNLKKISLDAKQYSTNMGKALTLRPWAKTRLEYLKNTHYPKVLEYFNKLKSFASHYGIEITMLELRAVLEYIGRPLLQILTLAVLLNLTIPYLNAFVLNEVNIVLNQQSVLVWFSFILGAYLVISTAKYSIVRSASIINAVFSSKNK